MLYGVFSDVHSNIEALSVVLDFFRKSKTEAYICSGDIVGYGPNPNECVALLSGLPRLSVVCGNHDLAVIGKMDVSWFNIYARSAIIWTRSSLSEESRLFLEGLNPNFKSPEFSICHGTPRNSSEEYLLTLTQFLDNIDRVSSWPLFVGHTHLPLCFRFSKDQKIEVEELIFKNEEKIILEKIENAFAPVALNPGSVGQPRDHDWRASCALYDSEKGSFQVFRLEYDKAETQKKIMKAGLPEYLARRLNSGQ